MTLNEAIERYMSNAEYERTHGSLQGCLEFRQLVEWLRALQKYDDVLDKIRAEIEQRKQKSGGEPNRDLAFNVCLQIVDKYRSEVSE